MKSRAILLSVFLSGPGSWASAQTDPFQRTAPAAALPVFGEAGAGLGLDAQPGAGQPAAAQVARGPVTTFGSPRVSSADGQTKVVFDLPAGARYSLAPSYTGLTLTLQGTEVQASAQGALGAAVTSYRAGGHQVTLTTPFPLGGQSGWKATEATIASGSRVLIVEFGPQVQGGAASSSLQAMIPGSAPASSRLLAIPAAPMAQAGGSAALGRTRASTYQLPPAAPLTVQVAVPNPIVIERPAPVASTPATASTSGTVVAAPITGKDLPPGDGIVTRPAAATLPPELAGGDMATSSALSGQIPGSSSGAALDAPRIGKNPGMTRVVVDLPAGAAYHITPQSTGMQVSISGVQAPALAARSVSPELSSWSYHPQGSGAAVLSLQTGTPLTEASGWRAFLLPPAGGSGRHRLAIDLAPAFANLRPIQPAERAIPYMANLPVRGSGGLVYASSVKPRVVIDPGHGGKDPGAVGAVVEKEAVLEVGLKVRDILRTAGIDAVMTRDRDMNLHPDKATDLRMRANMGQSGQLFVSVHANAMPSQNALKGYGVETWYNNNHRLSPALASIMQKSMVDVSGAYSRGLRNYQSLGVLRTNRVPAVLVEIGFVSHPVDGLNLKDDNYIDRVALGIAKGIHESLRTGVSAAGSETVGQLAGRGSE